MRRPPSNQHNQRSQNRSQVAWFLATALLAAVGSCRGHEEVATGTTCLTAAVFCRGHEEVATGTTCPTTTTLTYENFGQNFMQTYCLRCHSANLQGASRFGAPADQNYDVQSDIRKNAEHIDLHAGSGPLATNTVMPEGQPMPTVDERRKLSEWLACGAP